MAKKTGLEFNGACFHVILRGKSSDMGLRDGRSCGVGMSSGLNMRL